MALDLISSGNKPVVLSIKVSSYFALSVGDKSLYFMPSLKNLDFISMFL